MHRDLKPDNIMLGAFGEVLVMDWGLAKVIGHKEKRGADTRQPVESARQGDADILTLAGTVMGTPRYMSPEQARGNVASLGPASDIYSLGVILFELLHGRTPVAGRNLDEIIRNVADGNLDWKTTKPVPDSLTAVCRKALAQDPADRYAVVEDLQSDITAFQNGFATLAENAGVLKQLGLLLKRHKTTAFVVIGGTVLATAMAAAFVIQLMASEQRAKASEKLAIARADETLVAKREADDQKVRADAQKDRAEDEGRKALLEKSNAEASTNLANAERLRAETESARARDETARAKAAKKEADDLISYMQYDLRDSLKRLENTQLLDRVNTRIRAYHDRNAETTNADELREKGVAFAERGYVLERSGKLDEALAAYRQMLSTFEECARQSSNSSALRRDIALAHQDIGTVLRMKGALDAAYQSGNTSLQIFQKCFEESAESPRSRSDLAGSLLNVGEILRAQHKPDEALILFQQAAQIRKKLIEQFPSTDSYQSALSRALGGIGSSYQDKKNLDAALDHYQQSAEICRRLANQDPTDSSRQRSLGLVYGNVGEILLLQNKPADARRYFESSQWFVDRVGLADPVNYELQTDRANVRSNLAKSLGDDFASLTTAKNLVGEAIEIFEDLDRSVGLRPSHAQRLQETRSQLERLRQVFTFTVPPVTSAATPQHPVRNFSAQGRQFLNASIRSISGDHVEIAHEQGTTTLPAALVPKELFDDYPWK